MTVTPSHDSDATFTGNSRGLTRRQVTAAAAWAAPVIALAVATPLAAASDPITVPKATVTGTIGSTTQGTTRTVTYSGGTVSYNNAGDASITSGNLELTFAWNRPTLVPNFDAAAFAAQGWVVLLAYAPGASVFSFAHAPIANGEATTVPSVLWSGTSTKPTLTVVLSSDSDDVTGSQVGTN
jgi:hypothetical protein